MGDEHVVHHQHITLLPCERNRLLPVSLANFFNDIVLNRLAIAVIRVVRQAISTEFTEEHFSDVSIETRDVPERDVIEPHPLTSLRMLPDGWPHLPCLQVAILFPDALDTRAAAVVFHLVSGGNAKGCLPWQAEVFTEIANEHPALFVKALSDLRADAIVNSSHVGNRSLTACRGRDHAEEEDLYRPGDHVIEFVMKRDGLIGRIFGRGIDLLSQLGARRRPFHVVHPRQLDSCQEAIEVVVVLQTEATQEQAAVLEQATGDKITAVCSPVGKIDPYEVWLHYER